MANFYAYNEDVPIGQESVGTSGKMIIRDLKTLRGVMKRCRTVGWTTFRIYTFSNFYDDKTFTLLHRRNNNEKQY